MTHLVSRPAVALMIVLAVVAFAVCARGRFTSLSGSRADTYFVQG